MIDQQKRILDTHPLLFQQVKYFECGNGWLNIIEELAGDLEVLIQKWVREKQQDNEDEFEQYFPHASQVKEKYGSLRFYMVMPTDSMNILIDSAERASTLICEVCGKPGKTRCGFWIQTLCDDHTS